MSSYENNPDYQTLVTLIKNTGVYKEPINIFTILGVYCDCIAMCNFDSGIPLTQRYEKVLKRKAPENMEAYEELHHIIVWCYDLKSLLEVFGSGFVYNIEKTLSILNVPNTFNGVKSFPLKRAIQRIYEAKSMMLRLSGKSLSEMIQAPSIEYDYAVSSTDKVSIENWLMKEEDNLQLFFAVNHFVEINLQLPHLMDIPKINIKALLENSVDQQDEVEEMKIMNSCRNAISRIKKTPVIEEQLLEANNVFSDENKKNKRIRYAALRNCDSLEVLCALTINKDANNLVVENHILLPHIQAHLQHTDNQHILVVNPSPNLVRLCALNNDTENELTFVVGSDELPLYQNSKLLKSHKNIKVISEAQKASGTGSIRNRSSVTLAVFIMPNVVLLKGKVAKIVSPWRAWLASNAEVCLFLSRPATKIEDISMLSSGSHLLTPTAVTVLPNNLPWIQGKRRKVVVHYQFSRHGSSDQHPVSIHRIFTLVADDKAYLYQRYYTDANVTIDEYDSEQTLCEVIQQVERKKRGIQARNIPKVFELSPELEIYYYFGYDSSGTLVRIDAYMVFKNNDLLKAEDSRITIRSAEKCSKIAANITGWLEHTYLHYSSNINGVKTTVKARIQNALTGELNKDEVISLRGFWFLTKVEEKFQPELRSLLDEAIMHTSIGLLLLDEITGDEIDDAIEQVYATKVNDGDSVYSLLDYLYQEAVDQGYSSKNPLQVTTPDGISKRRNRKNEVRAAGARHVLSKAQQEKLYIFLLPRLTDPRFLTVYMMLVLGMKPGDICALTQDDFEFEKDYGHWQMIVWRSLAENGETIRFTESHKLHIVPCTARIAKEIQRLKDSVPENLSAKDRKNWPLLFTMDSISPEGIPLPMKPSSVNKAAREALGAIGIPPELHELPNSDGSSSLTDLSRKRSMLYSNFEHHSVHTARLREGELSSMLGRKSATPLGQNYESYSDPASQHVLSVRIKRLEDQLQSVPNTLKKEAFNAIKIKRTLTPLGSGITNAHARISIPKNQAVKIHICTEHGLNVQAILVSAPNNKGGLFDEKEE